MSTEIDKVIADLQAKLAEQEAKVIESKQLINLLCTQYGKKAIYADTELKQTSHLGTFSTDEFYGQSLSGSMRKILEQRKAIGLGPATPREIYDELLQGGYAFETTNEQNRINGIRISLRKSSSIFHRLPDKKRYGLLEWYPKAKRRQDKDNILQLEDSELDKDIDYSSENASHDDDEVTVTDIEN